MVSARWLNPEVGSPTDVRPWCHCGLHTLSVHLTAWAEHPGAYSVCLSKSGLLAFHTASQDHLPPWIHDKLSESYLSSDWPFSIIRLQSSSVLNNRFSLKIALAPALHVIQNVRCVFEAREWCRLFLRGGILFPSLELPSLTFGEMVCFLTVCWETSWLELCMVCPPCCIFP